MPDFANAGIWQHIDFPPPVGMRQKQSLPVKQNINKDNNKLIPVKCTHMDIVDKYRM